MKWRLVQQSDFTEDWQHSHYRYTDGVKLDTDLFELAEGGLKKIGGTGFLPFSEIEILDESSTPVTRSEAEAEAEKYANDKNPDLPDDGQAQRDDNEWCRSKSKEDFLACFDWMAGRFPAPVQGYSRVVNLVKTLLMFCEEDGEVVNGFRTKNIIAELKTLLSALPATGEQHGWVRVENGCDLPELGRPVEVCLEEETILLGRRMSNGWSVLFADGECLIGSKHLTHWRYLRPLPAPPKQ